MPHKRAKRSVRTAEKKKHGYNLAPTNTSREYDDTPRSASRIFNSASVQSAFRDAGRTTSEDTGERRRKPKPTTLSSTIGPLDKGKRKAENPTPQGINNVDSDIEGKKGKKRKQVSETETGQAGPSIPKPRIMPNESLADYNRRVESLYRPEVSKAIKGASVKKAEAEKQAKLKSKSKSKDQPSTDPNALNESGVSGEDSDEAGRAGGGGGREGKKRKTEFDSATKGRRLNDIVQAPPTLPHLKKAPQRPDSVWAARGPSTNTNGSKGKRTGSASDGKGQRKGQLGVKEDEASGNGGSGLSLAQERILNEEREKVIKLYREMKAKRDAAKGLDKGIQA